MKLEMEALCIFMDLSNSSLVVRNSELNPNSFVSVQEKEDDYDDRSKINSIGFSAYIWYG